MTNGETYNYILTALNEVGEGLFSKSIIAVPMTIPTAPQNLQSGTGDGFVSLSWGAPTDDGGSTIYEYKIYKGSISKDELVIDSISSEFNSYNDTSVKNGNYYFYYITAVNSAGESPPSNELNAQPARLPTQPQDLQARGYNKYVLLSWDEPSDNGGVEIIEYRIFRGEDLVETILITTLSGNVTYYNDTSVSIGKLYVYYITALNRVGESIPSNELTVLALATPEAPEGFKVEPGNGNVTLSWDKTGNDSDIFITEYKIFRSQNPAGKYYLASVPGINTTYLDTSVTNWQNYYYYITAINIIGESAASEELLAVPKKKPSPPINLNGTLEDDYIRISWEPASKEEYYIIDEYQIYRRTGIEGWKFLVNVTGKRTYYHDSDIDKEKEYFYHVTAVNEMGESRPSKDILISPLKKNTGKNNEIMTQLVLLMLPIIAVIVLFALIFIIFRKKRASKSESTSQPQYTEISALPYRISKQSTHPNPPSIRTPQQHYPQQYPPQIEVSAHSTQPTQLQRSQHQQFPRNQFSKQQTK